MKKTILILGFIFICNMLGSSYIFASDVSLIYKLYNNRSDKRQVVAKSIVNFEDISGGKTILSRKKQGKKIIVNDEFVLDKDYSVEKWTRATVNEDTKFTSERKGNIFVIKGKIKGKNIDKTIDLGSRPLYIYPEFNLRKFVLSDMRKIKFWTLRRDKMSKLPMQAIKKGDETIKIRGKEVKTIKVYYSITGKLREKHYHFNYYYRKSDGILILREDKDSRVEELAK